MSRRSARSKTVAKVRGRRAVRRATAGTTVTGRVVRFSYGRSVIAATKGVKDGA